MPAEVHGLWTQAEREEKGDPWLWVPPFMRQESG